MHIFALCLVVIAGAMNGSFALPSKFMPGWRFENIWLSYAIWTFVLLPWMFVLLSNGQTSAFFADLSPAAWAWMIIGGLLFGVGQICFARALELIGFGLGFALNLGLGTCLGALVPLVLLHPQQILSRFGLMTLGGCWLIVVGLYALYLSGKFSQSDDQSIAPKKYFLGVILALLAGLLSSGQNLTFASMAPMQILAKNYGMSPLLSSNIVWPVFLLAAAVSYCGWMLLQHRQYKSFNAHFRSGTRHHHLLTLVMGIFWLGSLILYSQASTLIGALGPIVAWPLFMVMIIIASNFWAWQQKQWRHTHAVGRWLFRGGLLFLCGAVVLLAMAVNMSHH